MNSNTTNLQGQDKNLTFKQATLMLRQFVKARQWQKYHTPRNLVLALVGQVGQISEIFQWKGEVPNGLDGFSQSQKIHVGEQIADVLSYLLRLSDVCGINIQNALKQKLQKNKRKYPSQKVKQNADLLQQIKQQRRINRQSNESSQLK